MTRLRAEEGEGKDADGGTYKGSSSATKGLVSSLTSLANSVFGNTATQGSNNILALSDPTKIPEELLSRIRDDYEERNYLWTGDFDSSFASDCTFTDPTSSFAVENVGNLVPVIDFLLGDERGCRSKLMEIRLNDAS
ncbi:hypothetical protein ACHAWF_000087, partial [Thalassiosira exigua]